MSAAERTESRKGTVELLLKTTGVCWFASIVAQDAERLCLRLRPDELGVLPVFAEGTSLECSMWSLDGDGERYYVTGAVLSQAGESLWLHIPPIWRMSERRNASRTTGGFAVRYGSEEVNGVAACMDVSAGGLRVRMKNPLPQRSAVHLLFTLPGEALPVEAQGRVLYVRSQEDEAGCDVGIKFVCLSPGDSARIARYCQE
jgi:hypothetical protein